MIVTLDSMFAIDADRRQFILKRRQFDKDGQPSTPPVFGANTYHATLNALLERIHKERLAQGIQEDVVTEERLLELCQWVKETHASDVRDIREQLGLNSEIRDIVANTGEEE